MRPWHVCKWDPDTKHRALSMVEFWSALSVGSSHHCSRCDQRNENVHNFFELSFWPQSTHPEKKLFLLVRKEFLGSQVREKALFRKREERENFSASVCLGLPWWPAGRRPPRHQIDIPNLDWSGVCTHFDRLNGKNLLRITRHLNPELLSAICLFHFHQSRWEDFPMTAKGCIFAPPFFAAILKSLKKLSLIVKLLNRREVQILKLLPISLAPLAYLHCKVRAAVKKCINLGPFPLSKVADMLAWCPQW